MLYISDSALAPMNKGRLRKVLDAPRSFMDGSTATFREYIEINAKNIKAHICDHRGKAIYVLDFTYPDYSPFGGGMTGYGFQIPKIVFDCLLTKEPANV